MAVLILDSNILFQMIQDQNFYRRVPMFMFLKSQADVVIRLVRQDLAGKTKACNGCGLSARMGPLMEGFARTILLAHATAPETLQLLVDYASWRRGAQVTLRLYYKDQTGAVCTLDL